MTGFARRLVRWWLVAALAGLLAAAGARAQPVEGDITLQGRYVFDETGRATIQAIAREGVPLQQLDRHRPFKLGTGALWMRFDLPDRDAAQRWYLLLSGASFLDRASLYLPAPDGTWREMQAGDNIPVGSWPVPYVAPLFPLGPQAMTVWLRIENQPAPASPYVQLLSGRGLQTQAQWTFLGVGAYLGFGLLVFLVGFMQARLYRDRAFDAYCLYVACMLMFQLAYTGLGGLFFWPQWAWFNDAAPPLFLFPMAAAGIWFVREATAVHRRSRQVDIGVRAFCLMGPILAVVYLLLHDAVASALLNLYGLTSVILSISLCLWAWRKGEPYAGWLFLGFLPVHLGYPFPALRAAGVLADSWATQYAVLIGTAIEIPLLLWILHWRAKEFSESRARLRALDTTDPLTGLVLVPVLRLRLRDALRRAQHHGQRCSVMLVDLANHRDIVAREGREAGDRALVVAASRLCAVVRDVDTVCRVADTRFAILAEGSQPEDARRRIAQHIVARGLEHVDQLPHDLSLRFRVVTASAPDGAIEFSPDAPVDEQRLMQRMNWALDRLVEDPKRVVQHLERRAGEASQPG